MKSIRLMINEKFLWGEISVKLHIEYIEVEVLSGVATNKKYEKELEYFSDEFKIGKNYGLTICDVDKNNKVQKIRTTGGVLVEVSEVKSSYKDVGQIFEDKIFTIKYKFELV